MVFQSKRIKVVFGLTCLISLLSCEILEKANLQNTIKSSSVKQAEDLKNGRTITATGRQHPAQKKYKNPFYYHIRLNPRLKVPQLPETMKNYVVVNENQNEKADELARNLGIASGPQEQTYFESTSDQPIVPEENVELIRKKDNKTFIFPKRIFSNDGREGTIQVPNPKENDPNLDNYFTVQSPPRMTRLKNLQVLIYKDSEKRLKYNLTSGSVLFNEKLGIDNVNVTESRENLESIAKNFLDKAIGGVPADATKAYLNYVTVERYRESPEKGGPVHPQEVFFPMAKVNWSRRLDGFPVHGAETLTVGINKNSEVKLFVKLWRKLEAKGQYRRSDFISHLDAFRKLQRGEDITGHLEDKFQPGASAIGYTINGISFGYYLPPGSKATSKAYPCWVFIASPGEAPSLTVPIIMHALRNPYGQPTEEVIEEEIEESKKKGTE